MNRYVIVNNDNVVVGIRYGASIVDGEIESEIGESGQLLQPDGTFTNPEPDNTPVEPSLQDQFKSLKEDLSKKLDEILDILSKQ